MSQEKIVRSEIGTHILSLMGLRDINLTQLSNDTGIPLSTLHDLVKKSGKMMKPINICILADYFNVTERELILGTHKENNTTNQLMT